MDFIRGKLPVEISEISGDEHFPQYHKEGYQMLVLTRKRDEAIVLRNRFGTEIRLVVVDVKGSKVRLGIEAPTDVSIAREETALRSPAVEAFPREMAWI